MKSLKKKIAEVIEVVSKKNANFACGAASSWGGHQVKEPKNITKR